MFKSKLLRYISIVCLLTVFGGCGDSIAKRKAISQHTKDLAATARAAPDSEKGRAAIGELITILNGNWCFARCKACDALGEIGSGADVVVPNLMRAATCGDEFVEESAVDALASIGPAASPAVDLLIEKIEFALSDHSEGLETWHAAEGLGNIGDAALKAIPVLQRASKSADESLARRSTESLEKLRALKKAKPEDDGSPTKEK